MPRRIRIDDEHIKIRTTLLRDIIEERRAFIANMDNDPDQLPRLIEMLCVVCRYGASVGGLTISVFAGGQCAHCLDTIHSDGVLCLECACKAFLCRRCGADIDLDLDNREWEIPDESQENRH